MPDILYADREAEKGARGGDPQSPRHRPPGTGRNGQRRRLRTAKPRLRAAGIPHSILNARNDEAEAEVIAQAGALGAVTISTNMAGRGTDILLGGNPPKDREKVVELGGLYVIGTTRHEARRIDNQLRGRAGRQGDPGASRFFLSLDDDLLQRFAQVQDPDIDSAQRIAEGQNLEIRQTLWKYEAVTENHRRDVYALRWEVLLSPEWSVASLLDEEQYRNLSEAVEEAELDAAGRRLTLAVLDDLWSDYLASVAELRGGIHWVSWGGRDPLHSFVTGVQEIYADFLGRLEQEIAEAFEAAEIRDGKIRFQDEGRFERGATWTYLTTDQPFGTLGERIVKGLKRKFGGRGR